MTLSISNRTLWRVFNDSQGDWARLREAGNNELERPERVKAAVNKYEGNVFKVIGAFLRNVLSGIVGKAHDDIKEDDVVTILYRCREKLLNALREELSATTDEITLFQYGDITLTYKRSIGHIASTVAGRVQLVHLLLESEITDMRSSSGRDANLDEARLINDDPVLHFKCDTYISDAEAIRRGRLSRSQCLQELALRPQGNEDSAINARESLRTFLRNAPFFSHRRSWTHVQNDVHRPYRQSAERFVEETMWNRTQQPEAKAALMKAQRAKIPTTENSHLTKAVNARLSELLNDKESVTVHSFLPALQNTSENLRSIQIVIALDFSTRETFHGNTEPVCLLRVNEQCYHLVKLSSMLNCLITNPKHPFVQDVKNSSNQITQMKVITPDDIIVAPKDLAAIFSVAEVCQ